MKLSAKAGRVAKNYTADLYKITLTGVQKVGTIDLQAGDRVAYWPLGENLANELAAALKKAGMSEAMAVTTGATLASVITSGIKQGGMATMVGSVNNRSVMNVSILPPSITAAFTPSDVVEPATVGTGGAGGEGEGGAPSGGFLEFFRKNFVFIAIGALSLATLIGLTMRGKGHGELPVQREESGGARGE